MRTPNEVVFLMLFAWFLIASATVGGFHSMAGESPVAGDVTHDGKVDMNDVSAMLDGMIAGTGNKDLDLNGDSKVDGEDLDILVTILEADESAADAQKPDKKK